MNTICKTFMAGMLLTVAAQANAKVINGIDIGSGLIFKNGASYLNIIPGAGGGPIGAITQGVGQIDAIRDEFGNTLWRYGDYGKELNYTFDLLQTTVFEPSSPGSSVFNYVDIEGEVNFYANDVGTFSVSGNYAADAAAIASVPSFLEGVGHEVVGSNGVPGTSVGSADGISFVSGNGWLDLVGGEALPYFEQDSLVAPDGSLFDMTFNIDADNQATAGYDYSGGTSFKSNTIPEPLSLALFGIGLAGLGFSQRRKA